VRARIGWKSEEGKEWQKEGAYSVNDINCKKDLNF